jgi:glycosyltransferase involved in cell wall biosynthesis
MELVGDPQMKSNPKISVAMVCYNHAKYIAEAIESMLNQTYRDFELIIVDDGSTDGTLEIVQGYQDPRIAVLTQSNCGPSIALNAGIDRSTGEYVAFMSGDDVSLPNRLVSQVGQVESQGSDLVFCLPEIIGPDSGALGWEVCPWFYGKDFDGPAELYRILFYYGNFLCAPSAFCRRSALRAVGGFTRGLMQLQDFDYWIRACKKNLAIRLHRDPLLQYRYLYGENLSDRRRHPNRVKVETSAIYRGFFADVPLDLFQHAFANEVTLDPQLDPVDVEMDKSILLVNHPDALVKTIGAERIIGQLEDDECYARVIHGRSIEMSGLFRITDAITLGDSYGVSRSKRLYRRFRNLVADSLKIGITAGPTLSGARLKREVQGCLERGDHRKALMLTRWVWLFHPGSKVTSTLRKALLRARGILVCNLARVNATVIKGLQPNDVKVFSLARMYDYSKEAKLIAHEEPPERVHIGAPRVIGIGTRNLAAGEALCPGAYVSILDDAVIVGGSSLVISQEGLLLNDEMVDFQGEEYGIKSPAVRFRHKDKVILGYRHRPRTRIKEGILLSCDHDFNYFHWIVECLPKLLLVDSLGQFKGAPLLIPKGLHKNLEAALHKANINNHPLVRLDYGVAYHVKRLIFPSALSRVVDRYMGDVLYDADIVLSHKWISRVGGQLRAGLQSGKEPWRRLFLTRRKGLRSVGNLQELELMLVEHGFEIVVVDDVSLELQVELFSQAAIIVAPSGAALTNMLFCQPGTKVLLLMSNHETTNFYFWSQLGDIAGLSTTVIAGQRLFNLTGYYSVHDDYAVDPKVVLEEIEHFGQSQ